MNKKILVIEGSPRKNGNSDQLSDFFIMGAKESGNTVDKFYVKDLALEPCLGCEVCAKGRGCVYKDDKMPNVLQQMIEADIIVFATPVYFYSMSGLLKTFIDRCLPRYTEIKNKDFYFIATAADTKLTMETTMLALKGFVDCLDNCVIKAKIYGSGLWKKGDIQQDKHKKVCNIAYEYGRNC